MAGDVCTAAGGEGDTIQREQRENPVIRGSAPERYQKLSLAN